MEQRYDGQRIVITGASSGIGAALAKTYLARQAVVGVCGRASDRVEEICRSAPTGQAIPLVFDTRDERATADAFGRFAETAGGIDLAILNAGTHQPTNATSFDLAAYVTLMEVNYFGTLNCLAPVIEIMKAQRHGTIALVGSVAGYTGLPHAGAYCASKSALMRIAEATHTELAPLGISVRLVSPGFVKTPLTDRNDFPMPFLMDADKAADRIVRGLSRTSYEIAFPRRLAWGLRLMSALPAPVRHKLARRFL